MTWVHTWFGLALGQLEPSLPLMNWSAYATHRDPVLTLFAEFAVKNAPDDPFDHVHGHLTIDPRSGQVLFGHPLKLGSEFFHPIDHSLHLHWLDPGYWIMGLSLSALGVALMLAWRAPWLRWLVPGAESFGIRRAN